MVDPASHPLLDFTSIVADSLAIKGRHTAYRHRIEQKVDGDFAHLLVDVALRDAEVLQCFQTVHTAATLKKIVNSDYVSFFAVTRKSYGVYLGTYRILGKREMSLEEFNSIPAVARLARLRGREEIGEDGVVLFAENELIPSSIPWIGRVEVNFNVTIGGGFQELRQGGLPVVRVTENPLGSRELNWKRATYSYGDLGKLSMEEEGYLSALRAIYLICDMNTGGRYVGKAGGKGELLQRWRQYAKSGSGGNKHLSVEQAEHYRFSILEVLSPSSSKSEVSNCESDWMTRLHSRRYIPGVCDDNWFGLNGSTSQ